MIIALVSLMKLTEHSLSEFLEAEPAIYTLADLKVRYDKPFFRKESFSKETSGRTEMRISIDALMKLTSLSEFLGAEPDIYSLADLKGRYDWIERGGQLFIR